MPGGFFFGEDGETDQAPDDFAVGAPTGFLDNFKQAFRSTRMTGRTDSEDVTLGDAYEPIIDRLNEGFRKAEGFTLVSPDRDKFFRNPYRGRTVDPWLAGVGGVSFEEKRVWDEISRRRKVDPKFLIELGSTRRDFIQNVNRSAKRQLEKEAEVGDRATVSGKIGGFAGSMAGGFSDPVNLATLALGAGPAKSILHAAAREAALNMGIETVTVPIVAQRRKEIGAPMTLGDAVSSVAAAGVVGGLFGGGTEVFLRGVSRMKNGTPVEELADDELLAVIDQAGVKDPEISAARDVVQANMDIDRENPFDATPSGQVRHREELDRVTDQILDDGFTGSKPLPAVTPSVEERLASFVEPAGKGQSEQIAALTHDIKAAMAPPPKIDAGPGAVAPVGNVVIGAGGLTREKLIGAVVQQESRGNPNAVSPKGARGTMQVMPGTNADPGFGVRPAADGSEAERARVGRDYMDAMLKRYDGNVSLALAAYNAGPGRLEGYTDKKGVRHPGWLQTIGDPRTGVMSDAEWASRIPIKETRNYVPSVLQRAGVVADEMPTVAIAEEIIDGQPMPVIRSLDEAFAEHDADDAFISAVEACLL